MLDATDVEMAILAENVAKVEQAAIRLQQAQRVAIAAQGGMNEALRTILKLRGLNPDGYVFQQEGSGKGRFVPLDPPPGKELAA